MASNITKEYEINYHDVNYSLKCKLSSIVNFLCDVGNAHSEALGDTIEVLMDKKCAWVFYKYDIKMHEYPKYREKILITTEAIGFRKFYAFRKYVIRNKEGKLLGEALALFMMINLEKRRPMRIPEKEYELYEVKEDLKKMIPMEDIMKVDEEEHLKKFDTRYSDIDSNGHVNNVKYIEWAIESVPVDIIKDYEIKRIKILFEKETTYGEEVEVSSTIVRNEEDRLITVHTIRNSEGKELTKLEATWERE
ncbi:MAG: thioesterase [Clostridiaceae bacterium]|nr:thioesterase [Clostridiaceae bacterium]